MTSSVPCLKLRYRSVYDKIVNKNKEKDNIEKIFFINLHVKDGLGKEFTAW